MGCGASSENNASETGNSSKQQETEAKEDVNVTAQNFNETIKLKKANNVVLESNNISSDGNLISPQESLEVLIPKPTKPRNSGGKKNSMKSHERKELKQVQAWGKKTSTTETDFLEDLRTQRRETNPFYEQEYEISEVDETARFIDGGEQDSGMIIDDESLSEISNFDPSNQILKIYKEGDQEESFDVSKIIDVEKFRAANVHGEKRDNDNSNEVGLDLKTKLTGESQRVNRSHQDTKEEPLNDDLYNEDDRHLIDSIEKEFLITQDNFLPGQIVN